MVKNIPPNPIEKGGIYSKKFVFYITIHFTYSTVEDNDVHL